MSTIKVKTTDGKWDLLQLSGEDYTILQDDINDVKDQLNKTNILSANLTRGTQVLDAPQDTLANVIEFEGDTVVNHAPLFDSGLWEYSTVTSSYTFESPSRVKINVETMTYLVTKQIPIKPSVSYSLGLSLENGGYWGMDFIYSSGVLISDLVFPIGQIDKTKTFTTPSNASSLRVYVGGTNIGATIDKVMLTEGTTPKPFVANVKGVTNPTIEVKDTEGNV